MNKAGRCVGKQMEEGKREWFNVGRYMDSMSFSLDHHNPTLDHHNLSYIFIQSYFYTFKMCASYSEYVHEY